MKKIVGLIVGVFLSASAASAEYWADAAGTGTGSKSGADPNNLCDGPAGTGCAATVGGDIVYLCNPTTSITIGRGGSSSDRRINYDTRCPGGVPMTIDGADGVDVCMTVQASYVRVYGIEGDPWDRDSGGLTEVKNCRERGIMVRTALQHVLIADFEVHDIDGTSQNDQRGAGVIIDNVTSVGTTTPVSGVVFDSIYTHDNGAFGVATSSSISGYGARFRKIRADNNGRLWHGGGMFFHPYRTTVTSGWTNLASGVSQRASVSSTDDITQVFVVTTETHLVYDGDCVLGSGVPEPAAGHFCYHVGTAATGYLQVNVDGSTSANSVEIQHTRGPYTGVVVEDSTADWNRASDGTHGAGIQPDDLSGPMIVRRASAAFNDGPGFKAFRQNGTAFDSIAAWGNGRDPTNADGDRAGFASDQSIGVVVRHATLVGNETFGAQGGSGNAQIDNAIIAFNRRYGARAVRGALTTNYTDYFGNIEGSSTSVSGGTMTNNNALALDPYFKGGRRAAILSDLCLAANSPLRGQGQYKGSNVLDLNRRYFDNPPDLGALTNCDGRAASASRAPVTSRPPN